ncbi:hypothetical protein CAC42_4758 [Sphaceloma murrayae]|uniref:Rhodopsin domain-containing protein n=1 Tax=Sphaceloma murrayae TaxID=2082308 RepID=A0A2K1QNV6_9PEZI|nr:hypothetical protein CAC42_4758 [Sphaceloma murrayae]
MAAAHFEMEVDGWAWFAVVTVIVISRFASRILQQGSVRALQLDDWLMWIAYAAYTASVVSLTVVAGTHSNLFPPGTSVAHLGEDDIKDRVHGSKFRVVAEQMQIACVWTVKACVLIMYGRITNGRKEQFYVKLLAGYTLVGWVVMEALYFGVWCRPFSQYWAVPTQQHQCSAATNHLITYTVFNLSTDALCLAIVIPMFLRTQMKTRKKVAICAVFSVGLFSMLAAALSKYYSFTNPFGVRWTEWYCHESSTNMLVANLPFVYTLLRRIFNLKSLDSSTGKYGTGSKIRSWWTRTTKSGVVSEFNGGTVATNVVGGTMKGMVAEKERVTDVEKGPLPSVREASDEQSSLEDRQMEFEGLMAKGVVRTTVIARGEEAEGA